VSADFALEAAQDKLVNDGLLQEAAQKAVDAHPLGAKGPLSGMLRVQKQEHLRIPDTSQRIFMMHNFCIDRVIRGIPYLRGFLREAIRATKSGVLPADTLTSEGELLAMNERSLDDASDEELLAAIGANADGFDHADIVSPKQAVESFLFFFRQSGAGERAV